MTSPIALQLYSIRKDLEQDFVGGITRVAEMGYVGVEVAGFPNTTPEAAAALFRDLGLTVCAMHGPLPVAGERNEILETAALLGCPRLVCPWLDPQRFTTLEGIQGVAEALNAASAVAQAHGVSLGYHNHWFEFGMVEGRMAHEILRDRLAPEVFFELDTYWALTAGADPVALVRDLGARVPLLHIKDGPAEMGQPMVAVGAGKLPVAEIIAAGAGRTEWLIVELDECATSMMDAVAQSYTYLVEKGLAHGR